jgi:hypothetical protein
VDEVDIFPGSRCSTDYGSSALLSKHTRSDQRIKRKTARQLNGEFESILGGEKRFWVLKTRR